MFSSRPGYQLAHNFSWFPAVLQVDAFNAVAPTAHRFYSTVIKTIDVIQSAPVLYAAHDAAFDHS
jgi:hypothetical protein